VVGWVHQFFLPILPVSLCQVCALGTRKGCIPGRDCRRLQSSIRLDFALRLFNLTTPSQDIGGDLSALIFGELAYGACRR
jgi:hypothetical protein